MNSWTITGHLGHDPSLRQTHGGKDVLNMSVALRVRVAERGSPPAETTEWVDVTLFGPRAKGLHGILHKGARVGATGEMRIRRFTTREGVPKAHAELIAWDVQPLSSKREHAAHDGARDHDDGVHEGGGAQLEYGHEEEDNIPF